MASAFDKFVQGLDAGQKLQAKAVDIERQKFELEQNRQAVKSAKWDKVFGQVNNILSTKDPKIRKILKQRADVTARELGLPIDPGVWDVVENDDMYVPISQSLAQIYGVSDPEEKGAMLDKIAPFFADPMKFREGVIQASAGIEQKRLKAAQESQASEADTVGKLRKERNQLPITKDTQAIVQAYSKIEAVTRTGADKEFMAKLKANGVNVSQNAAGDIALIFNFMKMLDPVSAVREGEQALAAKARGVPEEWRNTYNMLLTGQKLTVEQRNRMLNESKATYLAQLRAQEKTDRFYSQEAQNLGIDPSRIVVDFAIDSANPGESKYAAATKRREEIRSQLEAKGLKPEQIDRILAPLKSKVTNQLEKPTNGSQKAPGKTAEPAAK